MNRNILSVLAGALLISFSAVWVGLSTLPPTTSAFYRVFFGGIFLLFPAFHYRKKFSHSPKTTLTICSCGLFFALDLYCWHRSILYIGPGLSTLLGNIQVFFMALCGILFFGEKLHLRFILAILVAFMGLLLIIIPDWTSAGSNYQLGVLFGIATAVSYTGFLLTLRALQRQQLPFYLSMGAISLSCALFLGFFSLFENSSLLIPNSREFALMLGLGLCSQAIGWSLIAQAIAKLPTSLAGLVLLLQPALSFLWDVLFFDKQLTLAASLGLFLTLGAIYYGTSMKKKS